MVGGAHWPFPYMLWPLRARGTRICVHGAAGLPERSMCSESNSPELRCRDWGLDQTWRAIRGCYPGPPPPPGLHASALQVLILFLRLGLASP